jgi:6-phosphogluconolactonase
MRSVIVAGLIVAAFAGVEQTRTQPSSGTMLVYFGTYTGAKSKGIYVSTFDVRSGTLGEPQLAAETPSPSFLAAHPSGNYLYAVNEIDTFEGQPTGSVSAFAVDRSTGKLSLLNQQSSRGAGPAHLSVDRSGRDVLVANYGGGNIAVLPIAGDGRLAPASAFVQHTGSSVNASRQKGPHAHAINVDPSNRFAYVADLGLDKVLIYRFDADRGALEPNDPPSASVQAGAGPRHLAIPATGRFLYVINELICTVTAFTRDPQTGGLKAMQTISTLPAGEIVKPDYSTAELLLHPSGRFLYGSNRGHNTIVEFSVDQKTGRLTYVENEPTKGRTPRGFGIDPSGTWLIAGNQESDSVVVFRIDSKTGRLTPTAQTLSVGAPVSVEFVRAQ